MAFRTHRAAKVLVLLLPASLIAGCGSSGGDQSSGLTIAYTGPGTSAVSDVVFVRERSASGGLLVLDVVGRDIAAPLDGLDIVVSFDPMVVQALGVLGQTFLGVCGHTRPDNSILLCQDNVGGSANQTGVLLFSAHPQGTTPTPEVIAGDRVLATFSLRAFAAGLSSIDFYVSGRRAPGTGSYSQVTSGADPGGAASVSFEPDVPNAAVVKVSRKR